MCTCVGGPVQAAYCLLSPAWLPLPHMPSPSQTVHSGHRGDTPCARPHPPPSIYTMTPAPCPQSWGRPLLPDWHPASSCPAFLGGGDRREAEAQHIRGGAKLRTVAPCPHECTPVCSLTLPAPQESPRHQQLQPPPLPRSSPRLSGVPARLSRTLCGFCPPTAWMLLRGPKAGAPSGLPASLPGQWDQTSVCVWGGGARLTKRWFCGQSASILRPARAAGLFSPTVLH